MTQRNNYTDAFRQEAVRLLRESGKSACQLGRELGVSQSVLSRCKRQADEAEDRPTDSEHTAEEVRRLRREVAQLRMDRDILKKATAFFAKESS